MSILNNNSLIGASGQGGGYNLTRSLRFRASGSTYLNRSQDSGDRQKWTMSFWVKRGLLGSGTYMFYSTGGSASGNTYAQFYFYNDQLNYIDGTAGTGNNIYLTTTQVFRDPSAWYHIVISADTTQATASNRIKFYVNGTQVTSFTNSTYPSQNYNTRISDTTAPNTSEISAGGGFDGYLAEWHNIDGQALTPSSFGETSTKTGVWQPKRYTGTYGTNGFYLPFTDNSALTTSSNVGLGKDFSGNGNYWTTNNISITSGSTYDSMTDVPTLTSATASNFCVLNPLQIGSNGSLSSANLNFSGNSAGGYATCLGTIGVSSGKYYWEVTATSSTGNGFGIATSQVSITNYLGGDAYGWMYYYDGTKYTNNSGTSYGASYTTNDVIGFALDADAGTITAYKNGVSQGTMYSGLSANTYFPAVSDSGSTTSSCAANFGQRPFAYTPPTGFVALNTYNLPTPTIGATASSQANKYFDVKLWSGNSSTQTISGLGFSPDLVWLKDRTTGGRNHRLYDRIRGATKSLLSDDTTAELTETNGLTAFTSDGFTLGTDNGHNGTGDSYVGWAWDANGTGVTNTDGSITSTVSANTTSGFSIVTYTGTGANATVGHGLGVAPKMYIVKNRNSGGTYWGTYHTSIPASQGIYLNSTGGASTNTVLWNSTAPTSSVFSVGTSSDSNESGWTYVAYCFAEVAGFSKFGSYTGNGSDDGPFIHLGFRPKFWLIKNASSGYNWIMVDTARNTSNITTQWNWLYPNLSNAEGQPLKYIDILSNGVKLRGSGADINENGSTHIYMAFAENPFKYSLAR